MPSSDGKSRSEEHTSELQSHDNLVCRLLLEKKKEQVAIAHQTLARAPVLRPSGRARAAGGLQRRGRALGALSGPFGDAMVDGFFFFNHARPPELAPLPLAQPLPV